METMNPIFFSPLACDSILLHFVLIHSCSPLRLFSFFLVSEWLLSFLLPCCCCILPLPLCSLTLACRLLLSALFGLLLLPLCYLFQAVSFFWSKSVSWTFCISPSGALLALVPTGYLSLMPRFLFVTSDFQLLFFFPSVSMFFFFFSFGCRFSRIYFKVAAVSAFSFAMWVASC